MAQQTIGEMLRKFTTDALKTDSPFEGLDWGLLPEKKADEFIDITITNSALLKAAQTYRVKDRAGEFYSFDLPSPVLRAAQAEGATWPPTGTGWDTGSFVIDRPFKYSCNKVMTALSLTWETINWALTGPEFEQFLVNKWQTRLADDLELLAIQGDTTLSDPLLKIDDGWVKQIETSTGAGKMDLSAHIIDWQNKPVDHTLWQTMRLQLLRDPLARRLNKNLVWLCSPTVIAQYEHYLSDRGDGLGAAALMGSAAIRPDGIPFFNDPLGVPYMPEKVTNNGTVTTVVLGDPKNLWFIIHREFRLERERVPAADLWRWIGYAYIDYLVPWPRAFVLAKNVLVLPAAESS